MKIILLVLFISNGGSGYGVVNPMEYEMPDMAHCESVSENLAEILSQDDALRYTKVSLNCLEFPE